MMTKQLRVVGNEADEIDPFSGSDSGYDIDSYYTNSRDNAGNSETKYLKLPGNLLGQIGMIVSSRKIPAYRTEADLLRDAVYHRLKYLAVKMKDGSLDDVVNWAVKIDRTLALQNEMKQLMHLVTTHDEALAEAVVLNDAAMMEKLIADAQDDLEDLRDNYREKLEAVIEKYKGELVRMREVPKRIK